ncbi:MAG: S-layer homology domain-containing protein [Clostridia bacterium]|nr:S-layer homology domain-containing protein [Clostridia bacterium]
MVVTPRSTVEPKVGTPAASDPTAKVISKVTPPSATDAAISGTPDIGKKLTASYTYVPSTSNVEEGATKIIWETSSAENGTYTEVQSGTSKVYTLKMADAEKYIRVKVVPTDKNGIYGTEITSAAVKVNKYVEPTAASTYYVAANGNDDNDGTIDSPFATIEKARDTIAAAKLPEGGVTVYVRGGTYQISKTIEFKNENSGTAESPIKYEAYNGEKVEFVGGKTLDTSKIKKVTDEAILNRLVDQDARKHLYMLDLAEQGVKMSKIASYGNGFADYNPNEIYMNNMLLTNARWPNNDESQGLVQAAPVSEEGYNAVGQKYKYSFPDPENRSAKWTIKSGDAYMGGALVYFWADSSYTIDTFDKEAKTVTTVNNTNIAATPGAGWGQQYKVYFGNIFEEIDVPGEMYVDREKNILYFYPLVDVNGCEMVVSTTDKNMLDFDGASNITFKGIDFKETRKTPVNIENSDNIKIEGAEISGSAQSGIKILNSTNCKITGCHMFNIASSAIYLQGGDRETLKPSNNIIENNYIHAVNYRPGDRFAITMHDTVGITVSHNEFDDLPHAAIDIRKSNDITIEYNTISHALYFDSDMGSIYWGRDNTTMGIVVRYNYFRDFETDLWAIQDGYGDGVFWDDGAVGPELYGNVFYNGARHYSSIRANGGEVQNVYNNLIIDDNNTTQYAAYLFGWGTHCWGPEYTYNGKKVDPSIPANTWLYLTDMRTVIGTAEGSPNRAEGNSNLWVPYNRAHYLWSDAWKEHYKDTIWAKNIELYSQKNYEGAKKFFDAKDEYGLLQYIDENFPKGYNNEYHNNVMIGQTRILPIYNGNINHDNYAQTNVDTAKSLFKDYGKDFTLTDEGLKTVKASAPEFEQIPFNQMGRTTDNWGHKPSVTVKSDIVSGIAAAGGEISASYDFIDADGDKEGLSQIYWYVADKKNGEYTMIEGKAGKTLELTDEYAGRYLKYKVIPYDTNSMRGETVYSEPVQVRNASAIDLSKLNAAMKAARDALEGASVGTGAGQYPKAAYDELTAAFSEAQTAANDPELTQYAANNAAAKLEAAVAKFEKQKIPAIDMDKIVHMNINPLLADSGNWDNPGGKMKFENGSMVIDAANFDLATYKAAKYLNHEISFRMKFEPAEETGWVGIYFRQAATDKNVWSSGNCGLMYDFKKEILNIQQHDGGKIAGEDAMIDTVTNNFLSFGEEHIVTLGVYDTDEKNKVFWQLKVDGNVVYEKSTEIRDLYGKEGYFGFSSGKGKLTISPTEADKTKLSEKIANTENMTFVAGNGYGEYPKDKVDAFNKAVADAKATHAKADITQYDADRAVENIDDAIDELNSSVITKETVTADKTIKINSKYPKAEIKAEKSANDVKLETEKNTSLPGIKITAERSIGMVTAEIFEDTKLSGSGTLLAAKELSEPSANIGNAANTVVISMAEGSLTTDKAVRIVLPGQAKKNLGIIVNGKFSRVTKKLSEDSERLANSELKAGETAFIKSGDDYIIWTKVLGEFVTYNTSSSDDSNNNEQPGGGSGNGTTSNPYGNKGSGGFYSSDTTNPNLDTEFCFNDIKDHWAKADIMAMYRIGVVSGVSETTFEPDRNVTRAEFAALIARALKLSEDAPSKFSDVENGSWYEASVNACAKAEIITGFDGKFRPGDTITRNEMAVIIANAYSYLGKKGENGGIDKFADKAAIADWAKPAVDVCTSVGLISGMTDSTFEGDKTATRAQAASILRRLLDK